jgi:hypothetical protein
MTHPRHVTSQQFADGTTIDGDRLDSAMRDVVGHATKIPKGDIRRRFVETKYVMGWHPRSTWGESMAPSGFQHPLPWLPERNVAGDILGGADAPRNARRLKGSKIPRLSDIESNDGRYTGGVRQLVWTTPIIFRHPVIVTALDVLFHTDDLTATEAYLNGFLYGDPAPEGYSPGDPSKDVAVILATDSAFRPEDPRHSIVELCRSEFRPAWETVSHNDQAAAGDDWPGGGLHGMYLPLRGLNVPIPRDSRVRLSVAIPQYDNDRLHIGSWHLRPWQQQGYSVTLTVLEEIES